MNELSDREKILRALQRAHVPLSIDDICRAAFGTVGDNERAAVRQKIFHLDQAGRIVKHPQKYELRRN